MILIGTLVTFLSFLGFGLMGPSLWLYCFFWVIYRGGNIFCGPIPYQVMLSQWFRRYRGTAIAAAYLGIGVFGGISAKYIAQPLTEAFGFRVGLIGIGALMFATWPIAIWIMRDRPSETGDFPDGIPPTSAEAGTKDQPQSFGYLLRQPAFWLLMVGSFCSIGSIGSINQHMKLIFLDGFHHTQGSGPGEQRLLNDMFSTALLWIMLISNGGRLVMGFLADCFSKKLVMLATYVLVACSIPLLFQLSPPRAPYLFTVLFGLGMGADYMMIPLVAAEHFGVATLARAMAFILPADTLGQACFPYLIALLRERTGDYRQPLMVVFGLAVAGALAIAFLPRANRIGTAG
jgi:Major Facilitator Superfamily